MQGSIYRHERRNANVEMGKATERINKMDWKGILERKRVRYRYTRNKEKKKEGEECRC
jgi:hypothetical protein